MIWKKDFGTEHMKSFEYVLIATIVFFLIGITTKNPIPFIAVGVFVTYLIVYKLYDRSIGKELYLNNERMTLKLFPGEKSKLTFQLQNHSIFPMINGEFQLQIGPVINAYQNREKSLNKYWNYIKIPLSVFKRRKTMVEIPIIAEQRGTTRIKNIKFLIPHLFCFDSIVLQFVPFYYTEIIVFPKIVPVQGVASVFHMIPGNGRTNFSPFEDILSPLGTRDYSYSDPFHRINWKASVKTQALQTNIYEKVVDMSFIFIVNLGMSNEANNMKKISENTESLLSYTAYLSQYATEKGLPFEIVINARKPGKVPYVNLQEGEGKVHYGRALETLARINKQSMITPFHQMLHQVGKQFLIPKTIIMIGEIPAGTNRVIDTWKQGQKAIYQIQQKGDGAVLKPWTREVVTNAN